MEARDASSIRDAQRLNADDMARIHVRAFKDFFMTSLGERFISSYYRALIDYPGSIAYVYTEGGAIKGFVTAVANPQKFYSWLFKRRGFSLCIFAIPAIIRNPRLISGVFSSMKSTRERTSGRIIEWTSMAVEPDSQGKGIAGDLVEKLKQRAGEIGASEIFLHTDAIDNSSVQQFFVNRGFELVGELERTDGRLMYEYRYSVNESA